MSVLRFIFPVLCCLFLTAPLWSAETVCYLIPYSEKGGSGAAVFIQCPEGGCILVDPGPKDSPVLNYIKRFHLKEINLIIATVADSEHIGSLAPLLQDYPVNQITMPKVYEGDADYKAALIAVRNQKAKILPANSNLKIGSVDPNTTVTCLYPPEGVVENQTPDQNTAVFRVTYEARSLLLVGKPDKTMQEYLMKDTSSNLEATALKVGLSDKGKFEKSFISAINPQTVLGNLGDEQEREKFTEAKRITKQGTALNWIKSATGPVVMVKPRKSPASEEKPERGNSPSWNSAGSYSSTGSHPSSSSSSGTVHVKGYYRKDGTYVRPHTRRK